MTLGARNCDSCLLFAAGAGARSTGMPDPSTVHLPWRKMRLPKQHFDTYYPIIAQKTSTSLPLINNLGDDPSTSSFYCCQCVSIYVWNSAIYNSVRCRFDSWQIRYDSLNIWMIDVNACWVYRQTVYKPILGPRSTNPRISNQSIHETIITSLYNNIFERVN